jgi:deoxyribodipyrimidine photo-lyase
MSTAIVWFRRDLRLEDHPALAAALRSHERVVCVYIHAPEEDQPWAIGAASRWWLHHSLASLDACLRQRGSQLVLRSGPSQAALDGLIAAVGAVAVYWNRLYEPAAIERDRRIKQALRDRDLIAESFNSSLLFEPWQIKTLQGGPYKVFTPFWRNLRAQLEPLPPLPPPEKISAKKMLGNPTLAALNLLPKIPWDSEFAAHWRPGEAGAHSALAEFCEDALFHYKEGRDRPDRAHTSRLSPHLHFGEIGPRQILWLLEDRAREAQSARLRAAAEPFLRELGWRDFSRHLLFHFPQTPGENLNPQFDAFHWAAPDAATMQRWQRGQTGIPIVDAGMRELWRSGWMHNRVRMIVASLLTKNLRQHWLNGARWFWDTLLDADLANNTQGWQWVAGTGADAAPYFRIFNPVSQGERFDPEGNYVRRWVPELQDVPAKWIHQPWLDPDILRRTGYPDPIVDLRESRESALLAYQRMRVG